MGTKRKPRLVRYVSPFGSPATMPEDQAQRLLKEDDKHWLSMQEVGQLSEHQKEIGPPRIEYPK